MELVGYVHNGVIVLQDSGPLPEGTRVKISVDAVNDVPRTAKELLSKFAGCMTDLPEDLARNHDHYIHGTPKQ